MRRLRRAPREAREGGVTNGVSDVLDVFDWGACLMARISARALPCLLAGLYVRRSCCLSAVDTTPGASLQECVLVRPLAYSLSADAANAADNVPAARSQITRDTLTLPQKRRDGGEILSLQEHAQKGQPRSGEDGIAFLPR